MTQKRLWAAVAVVLVAGGSALTADEGRSRSESVGGPAGETARSERQADLDHRLRGPVSLDFSDLPLRQLFDTLSEISGGAITADRDALRQAGVKLDQPMTYRCEETPLAEALREMLRPAGLTFEVRDEAVVITTMPRRAPARSRPAAAPKARPLSGEEAASADEVEQVVRAFLAGLEGERRRQLEERYLGPVTVNFRDVPLGQAIEDLAAAARVNLVVDRRAIAHAGVCLNRPVSLKVERVALKACLDILLRHTGLTHVIQDEVVQVTTAEAARGRPITVAYPVADLVIPIGCGECELLPLFCRNDVEYLKSRKPGSTCEDALIKLITSSIEPARWDAVGGKGTLQFFPLGQALVVCQTADVQKQVHNLIAALREQQRREDREYRLTARLIESRRVAPDFRRAQTQEVELFPRVTFVRGQRFRVKSGNLVAVREGTVRDLVDGQANQCEAAAEAVEVGQVLTCQVVKAGEGKIRLNVAFQTNEIDQATRDSIVTSGRTYRGIYRMRPGATARLVLDHDAAGDPSRWLEITVEELPEQVEGQQIDLGSLPPIPR